MDVKTIIIACLVVSAASTALLALCAFRRADAPGGRAYTGLLICITLYNLGYALELSQTSLAGIRFALRIEYLGISFIPAFWVLMALRYTGYAKYIPKWLHLSIFFIPFVTLILHNTNEFHHLFYRSLSLNTTGPFPLAAIDKGVWYMVHILYSNVCILAGNILFYLMMLNSWGPFRRQAAIMFSASLLPWVGNIVYQAGLTPYGIDIHPMVLALVSPFIALAMLRYRMFDLAPIARDTVFEVMQDPVVILDEYDRLADYNRAAAEVFPLLDARMIGQPSTEVFTEHQPLLAHIANRSSGHREIEVPQADSTALLFDVRLNAISSVKRNSGGKLVIFHDITRQRQLYNQLQELAIRDGLTGCYNRRHLMDLFQDEMERAKRYGHPFSLILIDLDDFKQINDTHGHQVGDRVLGNASRVFRTNLRTFDVLGRYGGEEFAVLLPETGPALGRSIAERLRESLEAQPVLVDGRPINITASFGVAGADQLLSEDSFENLLQRADKALYQAKGKGKNRVEVL